MECHGVTLMVGKSLFCSLWLYKDHQNQQNYENVIMLLMGMYKKHCFYCHNFPCTFFSHLSHHDKCQNFTSISTVQPCKRRISQTYSQILWCFTFIYQLVIQEPNNIYRMQQFISGIEYFLKLVNCIISSPEKTVQIWFFSHKIYKLSLIHI